MQISQQCYGKISSLLEELCESYIRFNENPIEYIKQSSNVGVPLGAINAPPDSMEKMSEKRRKSEPCIFQLHKTTKSEKLTSEICENVIRTNNLKCLLSEIKPIIEASIYEYVNLRYEQLLSSGFQEEHPFEFDKDLLSIVLERRIKDFQRGFSKRVFDFPVVAFKLSKEIQLSNNISLVKINPENLANVDSQFMARFHETRIYDVNFYLRVRISKKCSDEYSRNLARRVEGAMIGCINLVTSYQNSKTLSFISANERSNHLSTFYRYGKDVNNMEDVQNYFFPVHIPKDDSLWNDLIRGNKTQESIANRIIEVPELMIEFSDKRNTLLERVERSLKWFRDAVNESDGQVRIQKVVTSIEALVNFSDGDTTQSFIRRIVKLHSLESDCIDKIEGRAKKLYKARSKIVHGSSLDESLGFSLIHFSSQCIALGVTCYSIFGLHEPKNSKQLKAWLDSE